VGFDVVRLATSHLTAASHLLAARHAAEHRLEPLLPALSIDDARALVDGALARPGAVGWGATTTDGDLAGFLIGAPSSAVAGVAPAVLVPATGHAAAPDVIPALHAALTARWRARDRHIQVGVHDAASRDVLTHLGFEPFLMIALAALPVVGTTVPSTVTIRQATIDDLAALVMLARAQQAHHAAPPMSLPPPRGDESIRQRRSLDDPRTGVWIAVDGRETLGMLVLQPPAAAFSPLHLPPATIHLPDAIVLPTARGRGIGAALVAEAFGWVHAIGYRHVALHVHAANTAAWRFWEARGFRAVAEQRVRRARA
jgi:ribosomal protein S18 acetylase RimI-like enzyme